MRYCFSNGNYAIFFGCVIFGPFVSICFIDGTPRMSSRTQDLSRSDMTKVVESDITTHPFQYLITAEVIRDDGYHVPLCDQLFNASCLIGVLGVDSGSLF